MREIIRNYKQYRDLLRDIKKSPFISPETKIYFGKREVGSPYFYPRRIEDGKYVECEIALEFTSFGWKTKFDSYRHEWNPGWTIVFFDLQLYVNKTISDTISPFGGMEDMCLWEGYLNWKYNTDITLDNEERFKEFLIKFSCTWGNNEDGYTDYMYKILKPEYIKLYNIYKDEITKIRSDMV